MSRFFRVAVAEAPHRALPATEQPRVQITADDGRIPFTQAGDRGLGLGASPTRREDPEAARPRERIEMNAGHLHAPGPAIARSALDAGADRDAPLPRERQFHGDELLEGERRQDGVAAVLERRVIPVPHRGSVVERQPAAAGDAHDVLACAIGRARRDSPQNSNTFFLYAHTFSILFARFGIISLINLKT